MWHNTHPSQPSLVEVKIATKVIFVRASVVSNGVAWEAGEYASLDPGLGDPVTPLLLLLLAGILLLGTDGLRLRSDGPSVSFSNSSLPPGKPCVLDDQCYCFSEVVIVSADLGLIVYASGRCHHVRSRTVRSCYTSADTDDIVHSRPAARVSAFNCCRFRATMTGR